MPNIERIALVEGVQVCPELACFGCQGGYDLHDALVAETFGQRHGRFVKDASS
jgi:hypothetical protein